MSFGQVGLSPAYSAGEDSLVDDSSHRFARPRWMTASGYWCRRSWSRVMISAMGSPEETMASGFGLEAHVPTCCAVMNASASP